MHNWMICMYKFVYLTWLGWLTNGTRPVPFQLFQRGIPSVADRVRQQTNLLPLPPSE